MAEGPIKLFSSLAERYPQPTGADMVQGIVRAGLAAIPIIGGPLPELLALVVTPSVERRREEWYKDLADTLERVIAKVDGLKIEDLAQNEAFVSATIQASRIAIGNHQQEKRSLLRNALVNIAAGNGPDEDLQHIYLQLIDDFTPSHIKILHFLWTAVSRVAATNEKLLRQSLTYEEILDQFEPEFRGKSDLVQQVLTDLNRRGLSTLQAAKLVFPQQVVTNEGIAFLQFVLEEGAQHQAELAPPGDR